MREQHSKPTIFLFVFAVGIVFVFSSRTESLTYLCHICVWKLFSSFFVSGLFSPIDTYLRRETKKRHTIETTSQLWNVEWSSNWSISLSWCDEKTSSNEMNIVTCLCDVWWAWSFFPFKKHVISCACCSLLAQFFHLKQTMFKILTCKIEPDEKQRTHTIEKKWFEKAAALTDLVAFSHRQIIWWQGCGIIQTFFFRSIASSHSVAVAPSQHSFRCKLLCSSWTICTIWCLWRWLQCI